MAKLSVYVLAYNEERKIAAALDSVSWADEVLVVDSGSTDRTIDIAKGYNARIINVPFEGFGGLRNRAIEACSHEWIFSLDADERCTPEVRDEILSIIHDPKAADAYHVPRRNYFMGRWIRHSGWYPDFRQPLLFKRGSLIYKEEDVVHEGFILDGRIDYFKNAIWQFPFHNLSQLTSKIERYSTLGAEKLNKKGVKGSMSKALFHGIANFLRTYLFQLGFIDGWPGFVIALGDFEATFYKYAKLAEKQRKLDQPPPAPYEG